MILKNQIFLVFGFHSNFTICDNTAAGCPGCSQCWPQHVPRGPGHPDPPGGQSQCHRVQCLNCVPVILWRRVYTRDTQLRGKEEQIMTTAQLRFERLLWVHTKTSVGSVHLFKTQYLVETRLPVASIDFSATIPLDPRVTKFWVVTKIFNHYQLSFFSLCIRPPPMTLTALFLWMMDVMSSKMLSLKLMMEILPGRSLKTCLGL